MRKSFLFLLVNCFLSFSFAQIVTPDFSLTAGEYFWDIDPGVGNGTTLLAVDGNWDESIENVYASSLPPSTGYHTFNIRVQDNDGVWSNTFKSVVFIDSALQISTPDFSLTAGEYFWDTDPGVGNGTTLLAVDGNWDESLENVFDTIVINFFGYHIFNIRVQDNDGVWSNVFSNTVNFQLDILYGCTDSLALNYNSIATIDNDSCCYLAFGCTDPLSSNYDSLACADDGSCITCVYGCTDSTSFNYDVLATCDDGSCLPFVYGCIDSTAINYNSFANTDDGSCLYVGCTDSSFCNYNSQASFDDGSCFGYYGCSDSTSFNYDINAGCDNGSCLPFIYGCTDSLAINYDVLANSNDGSCQYQFNCTSPKPDGL